MMKNQKTMTQMLQNNEGAEVRVGGLKAWGLAPRVLGSLDSFCRVSCIDDATGKLHGSEDFDVSRDTHDPTFADREHCFKDVTFDNVKIKVEVFRLQNDKEGDMLGQCEWLLKEQGDTYPRPVMQREVQMKLFAWEEQQIPGNPEQKKKLSKKEQEKLRSPPRLVYPGGLFFCDYSYVPAHASCETRVVSWCFPGNRRDIPCQHVHRSRSRFE